ncbi:MAG: YaaL family protein [Faecalimonas sp.]|nr:YaaL family protein [Faecalimonas sp.]
MGFLKKRPQKPAVDYELLQEIDRVKLQMDNAYTNFQCAMDPDLIDSYIYESNAAWKRYRFLLRLAKQNQFGT